MNKNIACIILAAGKGERMKSGIPKALHPVCGRPMLSYVLDLARDLKIRNLVAVLGHKHEQVRKFVPRGIKIALQKRLLGTADAVKEGLKALKGFKGAVLILYADNPLLTRETVKKLLDYHLKNSPTATLLTANLDKPKGYGRIIRDEYSSISSIVEEKDADDFQKEIKEINTGIICFDKDALVNALKTVRPNNRKKEYYLTDVVAAIYQRGGLVDNVAISDIDEALGINSRIDLARANKVMQKRINDGFMKAGVSIVDPGTTFVNYGAKIGRDTIIYPFTVIENNVRIGSNCSLGPFAHLREGTRIADKVLVGNFVEITRSNILSGTFVKHFAYLGDSHIGRRVNIGAGAVTANFDGKKKGSTVIEDNAFIGSDTVLVAPVKIGKYARTGAGAVVLKNESVARGTTVVGVPAKPVKKRGHPHLLK